MYTWSMSRVPVHLRFVLSSQGCFDTLALRLGNAEDCRTANQYDIDASTQDLTPEVSISLPMYKRIRPWFNRYSGDEGHLKLLTT